jgi:hypothetical protein
MTTPDVVRKPPGWKFWLLWLAATFVGAFLYVIPVVAVQIALDGLETLHNPQLAGQGTAWLLVLRAVLTGAACGSTSAWGNGSCCAGNSSAWAGGWQPRSPGTPPSAYCR